jgi:hypothetical protein
MADRRDQGGEPGQQGEDQHADDEAAGRHRHRGRAHVHRAAVPVVDLAQLDALGRDDRRRHVGEALLVAVEDEPPLDDRTGAEGDRLRHHGHVAGDRGVEPQVVGGEDRRPAHRRGDLQAGAGRAQALADRGADAHVVARERGVAGDGRAQRDVVAGGVDVPGDRAGDLDPAPGEMGRARDLRSEAHALAGEEDVVGVGGVVHRLGAGPEHVRADLERAAVAVAILLRDRRPGDGRRRAQQHACPK